MGSMREQFLTPPEEYTPIPFWFWNDNLTKGEILRQVNDFYKKGVSGFVLHPRIGIPKETGYLSEVFMDLVHAAVSEAHKLGMTVILYDEGMYPSGSANGQVVKENPQYASRGLKMVEYPCTQGRENVISEELSDGEELVSVQAVEKKSATSINIESIILLDSPEGKVSFTPPNDQEWSIVLFIETYTEGTIRGIHFGEDDGEENAPKSADLLNPHAIKSYIRLSHDKYYSALHEYFGNTIFAMFTDEPDILGRNSLPHLKPWTRDFLNFYNQSGNEESFLPVLWFHAGSRTSEVRKMYRKTVNKKLTQSYYKQISDWCKKHGISLTGHPAASDDIGLLEYFQIPGQDVVWRWVAPEEGKALEGEHSTAGKCSADAARHRGRRRNLNEVLGVCGKESDWALSPGDMKWYFDWLFIRGVNLITPHAFYYSVDGKRRSHERPPDVGPNNSWWPYYKQFAQYIKRMSWLMTDSFNITEIAVLCEEDNLPWKITKPLFENQMEFNYLEEALFLDKCKVENGVIKIEKQCYRVIVIEEVGALNQRVIQQLERFIHDGGHVITVGKRINGACTIKTADAVVRSLDKVIDREIELIPRHKDIRVSKVKKEQLIFYVVANEGEDCYEGRLHVKEEGKIEEWKPWEGSIKELNSSMVGKNRSVPVLLNRRETCIYCVDPSQKTSIAEIPCSSKGFDTITLNNHWSINKKNRSFDGKELQSWTEWSGMKHFSGTMNYETAFEWNERNLETSVSVDLGDVYEIAHLFMNGFDCGVRMWAPYHFDIKSSYLKTGKNTLTVQITNSYANKMDQISLKSGLLGPVSIEISGAKVI